MWIYRGISGAQILAFEPRARGASMATPSDLERFFGYVRAFELAYVTDDWSLLAPHFGDAAVHEVTAGRFGENQVGRDAVIAGLRGSVHANDRRFDVRVPEILDGPVQREDGVWMRYALVLRRAGLPALRIEGDHTTRFADGRIAALEDRLLPGYAALADAYFAEFDAKLKPAGAPFALPPSDAERALLDAATGRSLARCYGSAKSHQDVGAALAVCSEDFRLDTVSLGVTARDKKEAEQQLGLFFTAFPDYHVKLDGLSGGDDHVTAWGTAHLTLAGAFLGLAPTGRSAAVPFVSIFPFANGQLRGERFFFDAATLCSQLGLSLPVLEEKLALLRGV
jgi:predicted ester cyclase